MFKYKNGKIVLEQQDVVPQVSNDADSLARSRISPEEAKKPGIATLLRMRIYSDY